MSVIIGKAELHHIDCMECQKKKGGFAKGHKFQSWNGRKHSDETKEKMRIARLKNNPMHNPEVVKKRSQTLIANGTFAKEKGNNWKGGITPESLLARTSKEYLEWRDSVFIRDDYRCQHCFSRCGNGKDVHLHAHHLKKFSEYPELRFDLSNGLTLCKECHYKEHSK